MAQAKQAGRPRIPYSGTGVLKGPYGEFEGRIVAAYDRGVYVVDVGGGMLHTLPIAASHVAWKEIDVHERLPSTPSRSYFSG